MTTPKSKPVPLEPGQIRKGDLGAYLIVRPHRQRGYWWASHSIFPDNVRAERYGRRYLESLPVIDYEYFGGKHRSPWQFVESLVSDEPS